jgi:hypothetical protein
MAIPYFSRGEVARSRNRVVPARNSLPGGHPFNLLLAPALGRHRFHGSEVGELLARIRHQTVPRIPMVCVRAPYFPEPSMTKLKGLMACARVASLTLAACPGSGFAAADLRLGPGAPPAIADGAMAHGYAGFFYPTRDPRCRIVPMPEASLYGETARLRPTAVCQSQGLYADSVLFP